MQICSSRTKRQKVKGKSQSENPEIPKTPRVKKRGGKQKDLYPKGSTKWSLNTSKIRLDQSDSGHHFRYETSVAAARKYVKTEVEQKTPEAVDRDTTSLKLRVTLQPLRL